MESWSVMTATNQSDSSPAPGILPEPVDVHDDVPTAATEQRDARNRDDETRSDSPLPRR
jgi:hypothetical protein